MECPVQKIPVQTASTQGKRSNVTTCLFIALR